MELTRAMDTAVLRFLDAKEEDQAAELARAQEAVAALPDSTPPAVRQYYEATVGMMKALHSLRPPVREAAARSLRAELKERARRRRGETGQA